MKKGETNMNKNIIKTALVLSLAAISANGYAANTSDIESLEKQFISLENQLLTPELRLDDLQKERSEYDGISGWFKFSKKKALDADIEKNEKEAKELADNMSKLSKDIQSMVFDVAKTYESKGDYDKAIEFYLKVKNCNDSVKQRLAACYKAKKDYSQAIKWLLDMNRTDANLLEVVDCYHLANNNKEVIYWLFKILEKYEGNSSEAKALKLIEEYKYAGLKDDYPEFYTNLSNIYIKKAFAEYSDNSTKANASYKKAVALIAGDTGKSEAEVSLNIVNEYQSKYTEKLEILNRQREAAVRNYEDKLHDAEDEIHDARRALERARHDAIHHYEMQVKSSKGNVAQAEEMLRRVEAKPDASQSEKDMARRRLEEARRHAERVLHDKDRIIRDYMHHYERNLRDAIEAKEKLERNRENILEDYIAPYKKDANEANKLKTMIKSMHSANY